MMEDRLNDDELKWGSAYFRQAFEQIDRKFAKNTERVKQLVADNNEMRKTIDRMYTMLAGLTANLDTTSPKLGQGAAQNGPAGTAQTNAKRRSLEAQQNYAPEMTYDEMYKARDARWSKGQKYRNTKELSFAFPKTMHPQEALNAAKRERYWMDQNDAIRYDGVHYAINPQWVERFVE